MQKSKKRIFIRCLLGRFLVKSCWYRGERIPRNQYFYIFNKEGGQLYSLKKHHNLAKMPISTHATKRNYTYQQATKVDLLEKDREKFFKIIKIKQLRAENEKKAYFKSVTIFLSILLVFPSFNYLVFLLMGNSE